MATKNPVSITMPETLRLWFITKYPNGKRSKVICALLQMLKEGRIRNVNYTEKL
jgi:hypothetical protein